jgi:hypothetical protein
VAHHKNPQGNSPILNDSINESRSHVYKTSVKKLPSDTRLTRISIAHMQKKSYCLFVKSSGFYCCRVYRDILHLSALNLIKPRMIS